MSPPEGRLELSRFDCFLCHPVGDIGEPAPFAAGKQQQSDEQQRDCNAFVSAVLQGSLLELIVAGHETTARQIGAAGTRTQYKQIMSSTYDVPA